MAGSRPGGEAGKDFACPSTSGRVAPQASSPFGAPELPGRDAEPGLLWRHFDLLELMGDTSRGVSVAQAEVLQKAIRSLKDVQLANNLGALANMPAAQLSALLNNQGVNVKEVRQARMQLACCVCVCVHVRVGGRVGMQYLREQGRGEGGNGLSLFAPFLRPLPSLND